ncbi:hypothetical protein [Flavobacterium sp. 22076]|uniref:hypothetical protein n=1 Tax=unclassified Flavobacterium TaxID=196869 RepID=UPI003F8539F5
MQPIKISIDGDYLDCQIYRDRLYLWTFNGELKVFNWSEMVYSLSKNHNDKIALQFCFLDGNFLYKNNLKMLFEDQEFNQLLINKFNLLFKEIYHISEKKSNSFLYGQQETPGKYLPTDTEIYSNNLYFITEKGLFQSSAHRKEKKYPVSSKPNKIWDCNLLSLKANKYPQLSLSGGSEGLFELDINNFKTWNRKTPKLISSKHSSFANYAYQSIYNSSLIDKSFMSLYELKNQNVINDYDDDDDDDDDDLSLMSLSNRPRFRRKYLEDIPEEKIFDNNKKHLLSWAVEDKVYRATTQDFQIVRFNNYAKIKNGEDYFSSVYKLNINSWDGKVIGGGTSYFGTIVECENSLIIIFSNEEVLKIPGPITKWRVYPRSHFYENHLHVIKDNCIEIYSFNHDYFIDQTTKKVGIAYKENRR